jgi:hypothetical protein
MRKARWHLSWFIEAGKSQSSLLKLVDGHAFSGRLFPYFARCTSNFPVQEMSGLWCNDATLHQAGNGD